MSIDTTPSALRIEANLISFQHNDGWLSQAAKTIEACADRIEELERCLRHARAVAKQEQTSRVRQGRQL